MCTVVTQLPAFASKGPLCGEAGREAGSCIMVIKQAFSVAHIFAKHKILVFSLASLASKGVVASSEVA